MFQNKFGLWLVDMICRFFYKVADKIVVLSPGYKTELTKRGVKKDDIEVIYNWCDDTLIKPLEYDNLYAQSLDWPQKFTILFAGNMGKAQSLEAVLRAAKIVQNSEKEIQFIFMGGGVEVENLIKLKNEMNLDNVRFFPPKPQSEISKVLALADVLLVHLQQYPLFKWYFSVKTL